MNPISYGTKICRNPEAALKKEWREETDSGAYAASSILGANTQLDHGLLVIPSAVPNKNKFIVLLSALEETLFIGENAFNLSTRVHADSVYPKGFEHLEHFYKLPFPTWVFRVEGLTLVKMVLMISGENTALIRYQLLSSYGDYVRLEIRPIVAFRGTKEVGARRRAAPSLRATKQVIHIESSNKCPGLYVSHNAGVVDRTGIWFNGLRCFKEGSSSLYREEDLYSPCSLHYAFLKEDGVYLAASTSQIRKFDPFLVGVKEKNKRKNKQELPSRKDNPSN